MCSALSGIFELKLDFLCPGGEPDPAESYPFRDPECKHRGKTGPKWMSMWHGSGREPNWAFSWGSSDQSGRASFVDEGARSMKSFRP